MRARSARIRKLLESADFQRFACLGAVYRSGTFFARPKKVPQRKDGTRLVLRAAPVGSPFAPSGVRKLGLLRSPQTCAPAFSSVAALCAKGRGRMRRFFTEWRSFGF